MKVEVDGVVCVQKLFQAPTNSEVNSCIVQLHEYRSMKLVVVLLTASLFSPIVADPFLTTFTDDG